MMDDEALRLSAAIGVGDEAVKLESVEIKNYRSLFTDGDGKPTSVDLSGGMNAFAGPNNCGKSNLIRAVALALDSDYPFSRTLDIPGTMRYAYPRVTLVFRQTKNRGPEATLFKYCQEYEESVASRNVQSTYAEEETLRFQVSYPGNEQTGSTRQEIVVARGAGARQGDQELLERALEQFRKVVRFVMVESGASLSELLRGKFREILHTVIGEHLQSELEAAKQRHEKYIDGLQGDLLAPLSSRIGEEVSDLFPEILAVDLIPDVPDIRSTLENVRIDLTDAIRTPMNRKGTGVRGGVLVAMLRYLADNSRRSMVFAVEEPEAFLHPSAQEDLRDDLEALAERDDVTLLVTTHSPFVVSREPHARLFGMRKDLEGRTVVVGQANGNESGVNLIGGLFRDRGLSAVLERAASMPDGTAGVLLVEGTTDRDYIEIAARAAGRLDLIVDLYIVPCYGSKDVVVQSVVMKQQTQYPVMALLDSDVPGKDAYDMLTDGSKFGFERRKEVSTYPEALGIQRGISTEAEDLWPEQLLAQFVREFGEEVVLSEKSRVPGTNRWHYGFTKQGKEHLPEWLDTHVKATHTETWIAFLKLLRDRMGLGAT